AGWAMDLFRGEQTREHSDLEIAAPAADFGRIRAVLSELEVVIPSNGQVFPLDNAVVFAAEHQTWFREPATGVYRLDVFREPHDGSTWICRRDETIRRPYSEVIMTTDEGVPYMAPEIVLLFKAKHGRDKDEADFTGVLPLLSPDRRAWLAGALSGVHPGHHWLSQL
ncbi:MAG: hypothetical protein ABJB47_07585, partial [Actinomycetota bacterium]